MTSVLIVLPQVVLLSTFPFILYWFTRPLPTSRPKEGCANRVGCGIVCVLGILIVCIWIFFIDFGSSMGGQGLSYPEYRLLPSWFQVALQVLVLPAAIVWLAVAKKGTLGLWVFAIGAGFTAYWAGLGWLPADAGTVWQFVIAFAVIGWLSGMTAGFVLSRVSQLQEHSRRVLLWAAVGAGSAAIGILASWPGVESAIQKYASDGRGSALELTPFSVDPSVMLEVLVLVVVVWLSLSAITAITTGYIKLGKGLREEPDF